MYNDNKHPHEVREELRQKELKKPASSIHGGNLADLVGGMNWKGSLILIGVIVVVLLILLFLL
jgi:hypothetical protein